MVPCGGGDRGVSGRDDDDGGGGELWREQEDPGGNFPAGIPGNIPESPRSQNPCLGNPRLGS